MEKIYYSQSHGCRTLATYHARITKETYWIDQVSLQTDIWHSVRDSYLTQWIKELKEQGN